MKTNKLLFTLGCITLFYHGSVQGQIVVNINPSKNKALYESATDDLSNCQSIYWMQVEVFIL